MSKLIVLGSSNAIATEGHENTHMVLAGQERTVLVDCVSSPLLRLKRAGVDYAAVTDLILTHFHPDHVSGVPLFLMDMWLLGRKTPLNIHGLAATLERMEALMGFHGWSTWPNFYPVNFLNVQEKEMAPLLECADFRVFSSPVHHLVPTIGIRVESNRSVHTLAYSADTEPCQEVIRLAAGVNLLIHEAAGAGRGHSSAAQAATVASQAEVGRLLLIHYPTANHSEGNPVEEAKQHYQGHVELAEDFMEIDVD
jgi:ribonuclease Z